ncbi:hypothetical protein SDC9_174033 [bioreactor metagenome]|uniref:Uncharacterized protein n=1 Tax=bioreactor metagenome TaxID=1076179 RepID=A0A645GI52_9ZZZZ
MGISGPVQDLSEVKCRSKIEAPRATAPKQGYMVSQWSDNPITASGKASLSCFSAPKRTLAYGVGYMLVQCKRAKGTSYFLKISTDTPIESIEFIPVLKITGFLKEATSSTKG